VPIPIHGAGARGELGLEGISGADPVIGPAGDVTAVGSGWSDPAGAEPDRPPSIGRRAAWMRRCWPASWRAARVDPGRPGATALALVAAAAAVLAAVGVWTERPRVAPVGGLPDISAIAGSVPTTSTVAPGAGPPTAAASPTGPPTSPASPADSPTAATPTPPAAGMVVSVSGKVRRPGLVEVPAGARVADALEAAGGALPGTDLARLNLARRLTDGEQVAVGVPAAPDSAPAAAPAVAGGSGAAASGDDPPAPGAKIDLNAATAGQLDGLPGVGPVTAQRILDWRTRNGRFSRVEQLREVEGIGERRFGQLRELVTV
jgi:competence protein ComEA